MGTVVVAVALTSAGLPLLRADGDEVVRLAGALAVRPISRAQLEGESTLTRSLQVACDSSCRCVESVVTNPRQAIGSSLSAPLLGLCALQVLPFVHTFPGYDASKTTWVEATVEQCPKIAAVLKSIPGIRTALLSRLGANTTLGVHQVCDPGSRLTY